jgi:hypothetical protein
MNSLLVLHGGEGHIDLVYFLSSVLTVLLPVGVFVVLAVLFFRAYARRSEADGGGPPPARRAEELPRGATRRP